MIFNKEISRIGKIIEIILLGFGIYLLFKDSFRGIFLVVLILLDWISSIFIEKKEKGDYFYTWKCLFGIKLKEVKNG